MTPPTCAIRPVIAAPIHAPTAAQASTPAAPAMTSGSPAPRQSAITTVPSAIAEPTDRSIPAEMMTTVAPTAAVPTIAVWSSIRRWLSQPQKLSPSRTANSDQMAARPSSGPRRPKA